MASLPGRFSDDAAAQPAGFERLNRLLADLIQDGAAAYQAERADATVVAHCTGRATRGPSSARTSPGTLFLVASLTKPVVALAVVMLLERGSLTLDDRVCEFLPGFAQNGKQDVRLRHLLTHTSGLPDMLPNNRELRARHEPLDRFVEEMERLPLAFEPGTAVAYQSMGFLALSEVIRVVSRLSCAEFLKREVFDPLGMSDTSLGARPGTHGRIAEVRLGPEMEGTDWHWNTPYWLDLGAPWGGLITTATDYARFCRSIVHPDRTGAVRLLSDPGIRAMTSNQFAGMPSVPEADRRFAPWGLGWRLNWAGRSAHFGDLLGPRAFGHWGATGTLCWLDPDTRAFFVLLTTEPAGEQGRHLVLASNVAAAALAG